MRALKKKFQLMHSDKNKHSMINAFKYRFFKKKLLKNIELCKCLHIIKVSNNLYTIEESNFKHNHKKLH